MLVMLVVGVLRLSSLGTSLCISIIVLVWLWLWFLLFICSIWVMIEWMLSGLLCLIFWCIVCCSNGLSICVIYCSCLIILGLYVL